MWTRRDGPHMTPSYGKLGNPVAHTVSTACANNYGLYYKEGLCTNLEFSGVRRVWGIVKIVLN